MTWTSLRARVITFLVAIAGVLTALLGMHLYQDHQTHHNLVAAIVQAQRAGQLQIGATAPTPDPAPAVPDTTAPEPE